MAPSPGAPSALLPHPDPATPAGLSAAEADALAARGWVERERLLGEASALGVLALGQALHEEGALRLAGMGHGRSYRRERAARGDAIAWLDGDESHEVERLFALLETLRISVNRALYLGLEDFEVQLARFPPGTRFTRHRDAFHDDEEGRRLTLTWYLNPGWRPGAGGELVLYDALEGDPSTAETRRRTFAPSLDRALLFLSDRVEHEVVETRVERYAVSAWFRRTGALGL